MSNSKDTILGLFPDNNTNSITASNLRHFVTSIFDEELDINEIQNVLTSTNTDKPLSALQGKVLDEKIDTEITTLTSNKEDSLPLGTDGYVLSLVAGSPDWVNLSIPTSIVVIDDLLSTSGTDALSANQGNVLDARLTIADNTANAAFTNANNNTTAIGVINTYVGVDDTTGLSLRIKTNEDDIDINSADISSNLGLISAVSSTVSGHTGAINQNTSDITDLQNADLALDNRVATNKNDIDALDVLVGDINSTTLESRISANELNITNNGLFIAYNTNGINANSTSINGIESTIVGINNSIALNTQGVSNNATQISTINSKTISNKNDINDNKNDIIGLIAQDGLLSGRITDNADDITDLQTQDGLLDIRISANAGDISNLQIQDGLLDIRITDNTDDITQNITDIGILQGYVGTSNINGLGALIQTNINHISTLENVKVQGNINDIIVLREDINTNESQTAANTAMINTKEPLLGDPDTDGKVLASTIAGVRNWVSLPELLSGVLSITTLHQDDDTEHIHQETGHITMDTDYFGLGFVNNTSDAQKANVVGNPIKDALDLKADITAMDLKADITALEALEDGKVQDNIDAIITVDNAKEDDLLIPPDDGWVLASDTAGNRTWVPMAGSDGSGPVVSVQGTGGIVILYKADFPDEEEGDNSGLNNVDNVSDVNKPISNATQVALDVLTNGKESNFEAGTSGQVLTLDTNDTSRIWQTPISAPVDTVNGQVDDVIITADDVGLGNVENTAVNDMDFEFNTWMISALDDKEDNLPAFDGQGKVLATTILNNDTEWVTVATQTTVYDDLDSTSSTDALSANQGNVLYLGKEPTVDPGTDGQVWTMSSNDIDKEWNDLSAISVTSVNTRSGDVTLDSSDVGLGSVNNTSDADKVSGTNVIKTYIDEGDADLLNLIETRPMFYMPLVNTHIITNGIGSSEFTRASIATHKNRYGTFTTSIVDEPRFSGQGILLEETSTNLFLDSANTATQTITVVSGNTYTIRFLEGVGTIDLSGADTTTGIVVDDIVTFVAGTTSLIVTINGVVDKVQVEEKPMATSYIETPVGSTATRTSETLKHTIYDNIPNFVDEASIAVEFSTFINTQDQYIWSSYVDSSNYIYLMQLASGAVSFQVQDAGVAVINLSYNPYTGVPNIPIGEDIGIKIIINGTGSEMFINNISVATHINTVTMPSLPTVATIGCKSVADHTADLTGYVRDLKFYDAEIL